MFNTLKSTWAQLIAELPHKAGILCFSALAAALAAGPSAAVAASVVYPTGQFPNDVRLVQAALDQGGTVLLKMTNAYGSPTQFNFGPPVRGPGFVTLTVGAELVGEQSQTGATTIAGGYYPVRSFNSIKSAVRVIAFDAPLHGALFFKGPTDADTEITGNQISHVVGRLFPGSGTHGEAMVIGGGRVVINDNVIEFVDADSGIGITQLDSTGPVEILRNRVSGTSTNSIECTRNHGVVRIEDNIIRPGAANPFGGTGIEINGTGAYIVTRNEVLIESPGGIGIFALGAVGFGFGTVSGAIIQNNHVTMRPIGDIGGSLFNDGIDLGGLVSNSFVGQNRIEGPGFVALGLYDVSFDPSQLSDLRFNTYVGNNIAGVSAEFEDVFLDDATHDTVLKGSSGTVLDLGSNNRLSGFTRGGRAATGLQVARAIRLRNQMLGAARQPGLN